MKTNALFSTFGIPVKHLVLGIILLLLGSHTSWADSNIFTATYSSKYSGMDVTVARTLTAREDNTYAFELNARSRLAKIHETSLFDIHQGLFRPHSYTYKRKVFGIGKSEYLDFDWDNNQAHYRKGRKNAKVTHTLTPGVLDSSLYQLSLQKDLYHGVSPLSYRYAQKERIKQRNFEIVEETTFTLEGTELPALRLRRVAQSDQKQTELVVLPTKHYHIAQIKQVQKDGDRYETKLERLTYDASALTKIYEQGKIQ